jgi:chromosome segregation ATPase
MAEPMAAIIATERGSPAAAVLRQTADAVSRTFAPCEQSCLDVGARLGDAIPVLSDLSGLFQELSQSLESEELRAAGLDLQAVSGQIEATAKELSGESQALADLVALNQAIAERIANLSESGRTISMLVFNVKIEAASLSDVGEDMRGFVEGLHQLAQRARQALNQYRLTHGKLYDLLHASSEAQRRFQESHQARLLSIAGEIAASVAAVGDRRRGTADALSEIGVRSQRVGAQIGQCVVALQVGDSTCQRIEHVRRALHLAAQGLESGAADDAWAAIGGTCDRETRNAAVAGICRLQSRQLGAALSDFTDEMDTIATALQGLLTDSDDLATRDRVLFGSGGGSGDSFLEILEHRLEAARAIMEECRQARAIVDSAAATVGATMADLDQRTGNLSEIIVDVTIIGTNALLKSSRLGDRGKGLSVIAQELRSYAAKIVEGVEELPAALREVSAFVARFSEAARARGADRLTALDERMLGAIESFKANGKAMTDALTRLERETTTVTALLGEAAYRLAGDRDDIGMSLRNAIADIDSLAAGIGDADEWPAGCDDMLDGLLRSAYTMASERQLHETFLAEAASDATRPPPAAGRRPYAGDEPIAAVA